MFSVLTKKWRAFPEPCDEFSSPSCLFVLVFFFFLAAVSIQQKAELKILWGARASLKKELWERPRIRE
jgi:hypothetical protein